MPKETTKWEPQPGGVEKLILEVSLATEHDLPTVFQWERDTPDAATPDCPACGAHFLGVMPAFLSGTGERVWACDKCDWRSA